MHPTDDPVFSPAGSRAIDEGRPIKVICIGAGFSGILCAIRLPQRIPNLELVIYDKNHDIGGTWLENVYPGVGCDVPSHAYQYTFAGNPEWSKFYAEGAEIHGYLKDVAWKYQVEKYVQLEHFFQGAEWNETTQKWSIIVKNLRTNEVKVDTADIFIRATGLLNKWKWPDIDGLHTYTGKLMHTARFDPSYDLVEKRIALIGAGSTGIQILPQIQAKAKRVFHYMKGKTWISPRGYAAELGGGGNWGVCSYIYPHIRETYFFFADNFAEYTAEQRERFATDPGDLLEYRRVVEHVMNKEQLAIFRGTQALDDFWVEADAFMKEKLKKKPWIYESIRPAFPPGCRRLTPGPGYLEALVEDNVEFIGTGIKGVSPTGILDLNGDFHEVDAIICATGFDYSFSTRDTPIIGRNGITLDQMYDPHPQAYMGVTVPNMPNYFMFLGPAAAPATGSFIPTLEATADYVIKCIQKLQREGYGSLEPRTSALVAFNQYMDDYFEKTVFTYQV
ncbi:hypothetical protein FE257_004787 [Aspergillus nanangensis]|uniref:FAD/NAD(P)-binding domain-containing protein n=1 Tax=Aspergillus nanangensis TaxID=2582783 RepID=A0AAD4GX60_ASPNN|nr:hypothetical protein FE257_004787 [Aspergillus nanangensis]